jgi:hypothetical protein
MMPPRICVPKINTQNYTEVLFGSGGECAPSVDNLGNPEMDQYQLPAFPTVDPRLASHLFTSAPMALCLRTWPVSTTEPEQYGTRLCASNIISNQEEHSSVIFHLQSQIRWVRVKQCHKRPWVNRSKQYTQSEHRANTLAIASLSLTGILYPGSLQLGITDYSCCCLFILYAL